MRVSQAMGTRARWAHALALLLVVLGGLLRLDAFAGKYQPLNRPAWARVLTHDIASQAATLRPASVIWTPEAHPYAGGDPINYLRFAREMESFYQPHVREPVYLANIRHGCGRSAVRTRRSGSRPWRDRRLRLGLPWFVTREAIADGASTSMNTRARDLVFYRSGWSPAHKEGITVRISRGTRSVVRIPLPEKRDYEIVLRIDPVDPARPEPVSVLFNRHLVGILRLSWNPERVGSYRVRVNDHMVRADNELTIIPGAVVPAGSAGPRFGWLDPADRIGVRLWYVRVLPMP